MSESQKAAVSNKPVVSQSQKKVVHIYQVRPEIALEHLRRSTGLEFDSLPQSLVNALEDDTKRGDNAAPEPPILTDVVEWR